VLGPQDPLLKRRAKVEADGIQREPYLRAVEKRPKLLEEGIDRCTGRGPRTWEELRDGLADRDPRPREEDAANHRLAAVDGPDKNKGPERSGTQTHEGRIGV
jgi:hypothetical protein